MKRGTMVLAASGAALLLAACGSSASSGDSSPSSLPNIIKYEGQDFSYGVEGDWPGGRPSSCSDLGAENVSDLKAVGSLSEITSDATASVGSVTSSGPTTIYTATRTPPKDTIVVVAQPSEGCFVVYSPMA